ncbi:MAG: YicC family protein [Lentisphaeria bacterium]|nr:YicC family protein [Lentisphaeria bacterium]
MIYSMTGFGKTANDIVKQNGFTVEISSVNRKQLELRFNLPREIAMAENELRKFFNSAISRGMVNIRVTIEPTLKDELDNVEVNYELLNKLVSAGLKIKNELNLSDATLDIASFFNVYGVVTNSSSELENSEEFINKLINSCRSALENFIESRRVEGEELAKDLQKRIGLLKNILAEIIPYTELVKANLKKKLISRLEEENFQIDLNDERLQKEILFYVDKCDVTEEITRLKSHFLQFDKFFADNAKEQGRSMDFLLQEMFREINTLGNKSGSTDISPLVVKFKSELEKIREQVQNIE